MYQYRFFWTGLLMFLLMGRCVCADAFCPTEDFWADSGIFVKVDTIPWAQIPEPVYSPNPGLVDLYHRCWEIAYRNMKVREGMPQSPFVDEGFGENDNQNWIWDTCFMAMFCKYAPHVFPGVQTLNNFYKPLHDSVAMSERIHIADNPPLFAWAEYQNALFTGDRAHVKRLIEQDSYLQRHFLWLESLTDRRRLPYVQQMTHWRKHPLGYFWEGGSSGMDNTVRGRPPGAQKFKPHRPNNPKMLWVDAIAQQALSCYYIAELATLIERHDIAAEYREKYRTFADTMQSYYYDETDGVYYDIHCDSHEKMKVLTPASYWAMLAEIPSKTQAKRMVDLLLDSQKLGTPNPWPTLSADHVDFDAVTGDYWRGAMWLPTAYMGIKAIEKYGYHDLAAQHAKRILEVQYRTFQECTPHTIWECYSPTQNLPSTEYGRRCRKDFCGWSALGPISLLIENVIGITKVDAFKKEVHWCVSDRSATLGIKRLRFGDVVTDLVSARGRVVIRSSGDYTLFLNGTRYPVAPGEHVIQIP